MCKEDPCCEPGKCVLKTHAQCSDLHNDCCKNCVVSLKYKPLNWKIGFVDPPPPFFFQFAIKFLPFDQLANTFAKLFLYNKQSYIFALILGICNKIS